MSSPIRPGTRVLVRWAGLPHVSPCGRHLERELPLFQQVGIVDRIEAWRGEHGLNVPPFGSLWVGAFRPNELVPVPT